MLGLGAHRITQLPGGQSANLVCTLLGLGHGSRGRDRLTVQAGPQTLLIMSRLSGHSHDELLPFSAPVSWLSLPLFPDSGPAVSTVPTLVPRLSALREPADFGCQRHAATGWRSLIYEHLGSSMLKHVMVRWM